MNASSLVQKIGNSCQRLRDDGSSATEVHRRTGPELAPRTVKRAIDQLVVAGEVVHQGERRWRRYRLTPQGQTG